MKHIESSALIFTGKQVDPAAVKYSLVQRLRGAFHVETVGEGVEQFTVSAAGKTTSYVFSLNVTLKAEEKHVRILTDGSNEVSLGVRVFYVLSLLAVLALTLFPGAIESASSSTVLEAIFFLVVGGFIIHDMNKKFDEPQILVDRILKSVEAEFSA